MKLWYIYMWWFQSDIEIEGNESTAGEKEKPAKQKENQLLKQKGI